MRQQILQEEQQLRAVSSPTYVARNRDRAAAEQSVSWDKDIGSHMRPAYCMCKISRYLYISLSSLPSALSLFLFLLKCVSAFGFWRLLMWRKGEGMQTEAAI